MAEHMSVPAKAPSGSVGAGRWLAWWWDHTTPDDPGCDTSLSARERARLGRLTSAILLAVMTLSALSLPMELATPPLIFTALFSIATSLCALAVNRKGNVTAAALLIIGSTEIALMAGIWSIPDQKLDLIWLFVAVVVITSTLLPPLALIPLVVAQCLFALLDFMLQPSTSEYAAIRANNNYIALVAPILGQVFIAFVSYLWVSSVSQALLRADKAEELAALKQREARRNAEEAERKRELEQGLAQMRFVLSQLANGNFHARVRPLRDTQLWQLGNALNHFIGRLERLGQSEFVLKRTDEEAHRLAEAIMVMRSGRQAIWPMTSGTPLDRVIEALTTQTPHGGPGAPGAVARLATPHPQLALQAPAAEVADLVASLGSTRGSTHTLFPTAGTLSRQTDAIAPRWLTEAPPTVHDALAAPEASVALPAWLKRQPLTPPQYGGGGASRRHGDRPAHSSLTEHVIGPATSGLPSLRTPEMFSLPHNTPSRPSQPPRPTKTSLPRVRLEKGSLDEVRREGAFDPNSPSRSQRGG